VCESYLTVPSLSRVRISISPSFSSSKYVNKPATAPDAPCTRARIRIDAYRRFFCVLSISLVDWKVDWREVRRVKWVVALSAASSLCSR
jgi:hypothetical protein